MFRIDIKNILTSLVEKDIDRENTPIWNNDHTVSKKGIIYELRYSVHDSENEKASYKTIYVMFCGNTSVFYAYRKMSCYDPIQIPYENWINTSNHDSCWRTDGLDFISKDYFEMCNEVNPDIAPIELDSYADMWSINPIKVIVTYKYYNDGFKNKVVKVEHDR